MQIILQILSALVNADKIGGWVRAGISSLFGIAIAKWPLLGDVVDPQTQALIGTAAATIVVGIWSQLSKSDAAKVSMAAAVPAVKKIEVTDPSLASVPAPEVILKP